MTRRLHLVSGLRIGGKERVALDLCRSGRAAGHDDRMLLFVHPQSRGPEELQADGVPVHELVHFAAPRSPAPKLGRLERLRALRSALAELQPRVLHAHNDSALYLSSLVGPNRGHAMRRVTTLHNMPVGLRWRHRAALRLLSCRQDSIVCVSSELRAARIAGGWIRNADVIPNGVDLTQFYPGGPARDLRSDLGLGQHALIIGMLARFDSGKRHRDLIDAAVRLSQEGQPIALALAGDGPLRAATMARIPGHLPVWSEPHLADIPALLRGLDAVVLVSDHEGMPMSLLEAMACGVPVAASNVGGIPELLDQGSAGLLFGNGPGELHKALSKLTQASLRESLGRAGTQRVIQHYSLGATAASYSRL